MEKTKKGLLTSLLFSIIITLFLILSMSTKMLKALDNFNYDFVLEHGNDINDRIVIVAIDEQSLNDPNLGKYDSWNRSYYATVISKIYEYNPSVIGVDVLFTGTSDEANDKALVDAVSGKDNIVFASNIDTKDVYVDGYMTKEVVISKPYADLYNAVGDAGVGFANTLADKDSYVRKATLNAEYSGVNYSSLGEQVYKKYAEKNDTSRR